MAPTASGLVGPPPDDWEQLLAPNADVFTDVLREFATFDPPSQPQINSTGSFDDLWTASSINYWNGLGTSEGARTVGFLDTFHNDSRAGPH